MDGFFSLPRVPDDGVSFHELLSSLEHAHIVLSQDDLHGIGTEGKGAKHKWKLKNVTNDVFILSLEF